MIWFGIDVSKNKLHLSYLQDPEGQRTRDKAFANDENGHAQLLAWAQEKSGCTPEQMNFVLEATGVYHEALARYLHDHGACVRLANPLQVKRFAQSQGLKSKNDRLDGRLLVRYGYEREPHPWQPPAAHVRELEALLRRLETLEGDRRRESNRLEKASVAGASADVIESVRIVIRALDNEINRLTKQIDDHINAHRDLKENRQRLQSIPAVGRKLSAWFLALFLGRSFQSAQQVAAYLGLIPIEEQSGTSVRKRSRLSKVGDAKWRARLYMPALSAIRCNPHVRDQYQRLRNAGKVKLSAVGAAMRKIVHIAFGVFRNQTDYCANA